jgi:hypothetical protein
VTQVEHPPPGALIEVPYVVVMADLADGSRCWPVPGPCSRRAVGDGCGVAVRVGDKVSYGFRLGPIG